MYVYVNLPFYFVSSINSRFLLLFHFTDVALIRIRDVDTG